SQDGVATLLRHPTETLENQRTSLGLPSSSGLCFLMLGLAVRPCASCHSITRFLGRRPPYKSNFYCHPGRAGGTPMILGPTLRRQVDPRQRTPPAARVSSGSGH